MDVSQKYDRIGVGYNDSRKADEFLLGRMLWLLNGGVSRVKTSWEKPFLDVGCGTGNYTCALVEKGMPFVGVDPSMEMLHKARAKSDSIDWMQGKVESLPFANETMDGALATLTLHHWEDLEAGLVEVSRVLAEGARFVVLTATPKQMKGYWLNYYFPEMLESSMQQMPSWARLEKGLQTAGFHSIELEKYFVRDDLQDLFLYAGKHCPNLYLDERVRRGISSFADLANAVEVRCGLQRLSDDIQSGKVLEVIQEFENDEGDYLFLAARNGEK